MKAVEMGRCFSVLTSLSQYFQSPDCVSHSKNLVAGLDEPPPVDVFLVLLIMLYWLMLVKVLWMLVRCVKKIFSSSVWLCEPCDRPHIQLLVYRRSYL